MTDKQATVKQMTNQHGQKLAMIAMTAATAKQLPIGYALMIRTLVRNSSNNNTHPEISYVEAKTRKECMAMALAETTRLNSLNSVASSRYELPYLLVTKPVAVTATTAANQSTTESRL